MELPHNHSAQKQLKLQNDYLIGIDGTPPRNMNHRRQDLPKTYVFDGNIFACHTSILSQDPPSLFGDHVKDIVLDNSYSVDLNSFEEWSLVEEKLRFFSID